MFDPLISNFSHFLKEASMPYTKAKLLPESRKFSNRTAQFFAIFFPNSNRNLWHISKFDSFFIAAGNPILSLGMDYDFFFCAKIGRYSDDVYQYIIPKSTLEYNGARKTAKRKSHQIFEFPCKKSRNLEFWKKGQFLPISR